MPKRIFIGRKITSDPTALSSASSKGTTNIISQAKIRSLITFFTRTFPVLPFVVTTELPAYLNAVLDMRFLTVQHCKITAPCTVASFYAGQDFTFLNAFLLEVNEGEAALFSGSLADLKYFPYDLVIPVKHFAKGLGRLSYNSVNDPLFFSLFFPPFFFFHYS